MRGGVRVEGGGEGILEGTRKCIMMRRDVFVDLHLIVDMPEHVYGRMQTFMQ